MRVQLLAACLIWSGLSYSQTETKNNELLGATPFMKVKGDEMRRYPSSNFLDAINGFFPTVFSSRPNTNDFLFIVDGFVNNDVNSISLNDIEEVVFVRGSLNGSYYPAARAGTFYVTTHRPAVGKAVVRFNSQFNGRLNNRSRLIEPNNLGQETSPDFVNSSNNKPGYLINNHLSVSFAKNKLQLYVGMEWQANKQPVIDQTGTYPIISNEPIIANQKINNYHLRPFLKAAYIVNDKLEVRITGNFFHGPKDMNGDTQIEYATQVREFESEATLNTAHVGGMVMWKPVTGLTNSLSVEYNYGKYKYSFEGNDRYDLPSGQQEYLTTVSSKTNLNNTLLRNRLDYILPFKGRFRLGVGVVFGHNFGKTSSDFLFTRVRTDDPASQSYQSAFNRGNGKFTFLNPQLKFSIDSIFSGYGGYAFLLNKGVSDLTSKSRLNIYGGLSLDLKKLLKPQLGVNRLELSLNYADLNRNQSRNSWLPDAISVEESVFSTFSYNIGVGSAPTMYPNPTLARTILKNRMFGVTLQSGFKEDKIIAGVEWTHYVAQDIILIVIPIGNTSASLASLGNRTRNSFSTYISAQVIDKKSFGWFSRLAVLLPNEKFKFEEGQLASNVMLYDHGPQIGWQHRIRYNRLSLQLNSVMGQKQVFYGARRNGNPPVEGKLNELSLNYLQLGYNLELGSSKLFREVSLFCHGRNLVGTKATFDFYQYDRIVGLGLNLEFL